MRTKQPLLARNIKKIRLLAGQLLGLQKRAGGQKLLSLSQFGQFVNRAKSTVSAWETGVRIPKHSEIGIVCYVFDLNTEQFVSGEIETLGPMALKRPWPPAEAVSAEEAQTTDADTERLIEMLRKGQIDKRKISFWLADVERDVQLEQLTRKRLPRGS
jgi:hypothetical protein